MNAALLDQCEICDVPLDDHALRTGPLRKVCLECLTTEQRHALQHELEVAAEVQTQLLPARNFSFGRWQIHYHYEPLGVVSGDHIDLIRPGRAGDSLHFLFGDVSGKGVAASILMANLQALFRSLVSHDLSLAEIVERANSHFFGSTAPNTFATLVAGRLDGRGLLEFSNAGHDPPFLVRADSVTPLDATALPLGINGETCYQPESVQLEPDDFLFLYTDGVSETRNEAGEEFGFHRVQAAVTNLRGLGAIEVVQSVLSGVRSFQKHAPQTDDVTAMAIRWRG